jgi:hypothetical protein
VDQTDARKSPSSRLKRSGLAGLLRSVLELAGMDAPGGVGDSPARGCEGTNCSHDWATMATYMCPLTATAKNTVADPVQCLRRHAQVGFLGS